MMRQGDVKKRKFFYIPFIIFSFFLVVYGEIITAPSDEGAVERMRD